MQKQRPAHCCGKTTLEKHCPPHASTLLPRIFLRAVFARHEKSAPGAAAANGQSVICGCNYRLFQDNIPRHALLSAEQLK